MSKTRDTGFLGNVVKVDTSGNVSFVSGSTTLATLNTSGQLSGSSPVLSSSYASNADLLDGLDSTQFTLTSSFAAQTASFTAFTGSVNSFSASILSYTASQNITNGTFTLTSSFAAQTASFTAFTASVNSFTASQRILNGTYATTGSNTFTGIQTVNSNLVVTGSITAQTLVVQTITSSVDFVTGSTRFGSLLANTHVFTGSLLVTGSSTLSGSIATTGNITIQKTAPSISMKGGYAQDLGFFLNNEPAVYIVDDATATKGMKVNISTGAITQLGSGSVSFTGAATFTSNITTNGYIYAAYNSGDVIIWGGVGSYANIYGALSWDVDKALIKGRAGYGLGLYVDDNLSKGITLATTGAATFSSDVSVSAKLKVGSSQISTNSTTTAITTAKTIYARVGNGKSEFVFVMGDVGGSAYFADIVAFASGASVVVISSSTTYGSPSARTYSVSGNNLQLSMASGTAETQVFPISGI